MADAVSSQTIIDGKGKKVVMAFTNVSDGTGEAAVTKVDVSTLTDAPTEVRILRCHFNNVGMSVNVLWDATTDRLAFSLPTDYQGVMDFTAFGGLVNNAGAGKTGDIQFTTVGHSVGDTYSIILEMSKEY